MRKNAELIKNLQILMKYIFRKENLTVSYTADETGYAPLEEKIRSIQRESVHRRSGAGQHCV